MSLDQFLESSNSRRTSCCNLKIRGLGAKLCVAFLFFIFERIYDVLKSNRPCILLNKNINFNEDKKESKMENPHTVLGWRTLYFSSYKNRKIRVKLWWVGAREKKQRTFSVPFFNICVLNTLSEYTYFFMSKIITSHTWLSFYMFTQSIIIAS